MTLLLSTELEKAMLSPSAQRDAGPGLGAGMALSSQNRFCSNKIECCESVLRDLIY